MAKHKLDNSPQPDPRREQLKKTSGGLIPVAILAGVAVLILIAGMSLYETHRLRSELNERMAQLITAVGTKSDTPAPRPTGPDPNKVYTVKIEGSPSYGPKGAPITIAEFSEFQ